MDWLLDLFGPSSEDVTSRTGNISAETYANRDAAQNQAKAFRQNLPYYQTEAGNLMAEQAANEAQAADQQIKSNANNRGLLYSGLRQGAQGQARNSIASGLARRRAQSNKSLEDAAFGMETNAAGVGMNVADLERQRENQRYRAARGAEQQDPGILGGFLKGYAG